MALKAGYRGVKKSFLDIINSIKLITSIGDGLDFDSGELSVNAGDGLSFDEDGKATVDLGDGLDFDEDGKVTADLGDGLDFDEDGKIIVSQPGSAYTKDLLYGSSTITYPAPALSDYSLTKDNESVDIKDYDELVFVTGWTTDDVLCIEEWKVDAKILDSMPTATADKDKQFVFPINAGTSGGGQWVRVSKGATDNVVHARYNGTVGIYQIYGIKF